MLLRIVFATALAAAALLCAAAGGPATAALTANTQTYQDSTNESPGAPDITTVVASNNDAGLISFRINGVPQLTQEMLIVIEVDADANSATGTQDPLSLGADYAIELFAGNVNLFRWDGTNFTRRANDPPQSTLIFNNLTISISQSELGNSARFKFGVTLVSGVRTDPNTGDPDFSQARADIAPDIGHGYYDYTVRLAPVRLVARRFALSPGRPVAGRVLTANLTATRSDTGATLRGGQVVCTATVGGRRLAPRVRRFVGTQARCAWSIPASARGQQIRGSVTVVFEGRRVTRSFTARVG
jgi:hypothetical protein